LRYFRQKGVSIQRVVRLRGYPTPTKTRILGGLSHWQRQQIVRVDREPARLLPPAVCRRLTRSAASLVRKASALLVSDYGFGATDAREVELLRRRAGRREFPLTLDSRFALRTYGPVTAATPNEPELEEAYGQRIGNNLDLLYRLGARTVRRQKLQALLVTRGRDGMVLFQPGSKPHQLAVFGSDQVADVTGAGDTVIAAFTLALAAGARPLEAAQLANCAAGLVVMKRGTATVRRQELEEAIRNA
jgi:D-glycero-beta-D-manno-heptose-7-phosphate kinase